MPALHPLRLTRRAGSSEHVDGIYIAGFCFAGAILLGGLVWLLIRYHRKRAAKKRADKRGAAVISVRGVTQDGPHTEKSEANIPQTQSAAFSRQQIGTSVALPDKALQRPTRMQTNADVINYHRQSGNFPKPFSLAQSTGTPANNGGGDRKSFMSHKSRFSVTASEPNSSVDVTPTSGNARKVRQLFHPVLPDELLLAHPGERLTLVQSFDDGWCLVGREGGASSAKRKSLFKQRDVTVAPAERDVEMGVVPAWCFVKPAPGVRPERPIRSTSLGITVHMTAPAPGLAQRDNVISWSNF